MYRRWPASVTKPYHHGINTILSELTSELCPPVEINYNWAGSRQRDEYERDFAALYVEHILPFLLQALPGHGIEPADIRLLDIGCGFAPMALAFTILQSSQQRTLDEDVRYLGIDIREDAIQWLQDAYKQYPFIRFLHHRAKQESDYIGEGNTVATDCGEKGRTSATSDGTESAYCIPDAFTFNLQWSSSVFTHMTPEAAVTALRTIAERCMPGCVQVNTWFVVDAESRYAMAAGLADRQLPVDCGRFLSFSSDNPLLTTCYKEDAILEIYQEAGLEIIEIDRGSWRGKAYRNRANHYQDVIISVVR
ncbi:MAG TPA: hypothetical protein DIT01_13400 [Lentisphaeria bacterium]|nr:hypothetical protein [Lentisphaeria bacterium]